MRSLFWRGLALIAAAPSFLPAQDVVVRRLSRPEAEFPSAFTSVSGLRELADGRVLISDGQERRVLLADFRTRASTVVGREGAGPQEYAVPRRLFALGGDSTLLHDPGNDRYLVIGPSGVPASSFSLSDTLIAGVTALRGVDSIGRFYLQVRQRSNVGNSSGTEWLVRFDRRTGRVDTLGTLQLPPGREEGSMSLGNGMLRRLTNRPLAPEDVVAVAPNGRVAVVRVADYHVDWIEAPGHTVAGPAVKYTPIRITPGERKAFLDGLVVPGQILTRVNPGAKALPIPKATGGSSAGGSRPLPPGLDEASMQWPTNKPPFGANAASISPGGQLWVQRLSVHTDSVPKYDVFDAQGKLMMRVELPRRTRLVGFGRESVYLVRVDDDDLLYLQRHRL